MFSDILSDFSERESRFLCSFCSSDSISSAVIFNSQLIPIFEGDSKYNRLVAPETLNTTGILVFQQSQFHADATESEMAEDQSFRRWEI